MSSGRPSSSRRDNVSKPPAASDLVWSLRGHAGGDPELRIGAGAWAPLSRIAEDWHAAGRSAAVAWFHLLLTAEGAAAPAARAILLRAVAGPHAGTLLRFEVDPAGIAGEVGGHLSDFLSQLGPLRRSLDFIGHPHLGTWMLDLPSGALDVDAAWAGMLGRLPGELEPFTHDGWVALTHPEDAAGFYAPEVTARLAAGDLVQYVSRSRHARGHWVWLMSCCRGALWSADGQLQRIIGYDIDITEYRALQERTEDQRLLMQGILDVMPSGQIVLDAEGRITYLNPEAAGILGLPPDRAVGQALLPLLPLEAGQEALSAALRQKLPLRDLGLVLRRPAEAGIDEAVRHYLGARGGQPPRRHLTASLTFVPVIGKGFLALNDMTAYETARRNLEQAVEQARYIATHDLMTGLPDRYDLLRHLGETLAAAEQGMRPFAVMMIDLDDFKQINDGMGHEVGDQLLKAAAVRMQRGLPDRARLARFGGDEFVLLMPDCTAAEAALLADALRNRFQAPLDFSRRNSQISCSIGISLFPFDGRSAEALLRAADLAMYEAKAIGRGQIQRFSAELSQRNERRSAVRHALQRALQQGGFQIVLQPIFDLTHLARPIGAEVLLRLTDPDLGVISPAEFIPVAETQDLIPAIDREVIWRVADLRKAWAAAGHQLPLSVNLSPLTLSGSGFGDLLDTLPQLVRGGGLVVEVTETALMGRLAEVRETLRVLVQAGVGIAIDDFGIGHSSLSYLQSLPIQELKIDRSFVAGLGQRGVGPSNAIVRAILALAEALELETVAEGIETVEQAEWLIDHGCTRAQGFLLGRPVDPDEFHRIYLDPPPCAPEFRQALPAEDPSHFAAPDQGSKP